MLTPVCILASLARRSETRPRAASRRYFALLLLLETFMIGVFAATDVFLFYVLFEAMLIPMYFIIGSYGGAQRSYAAVKFLLYSLVGGLLMLAAVIGALRRLGRAAPQAFLFQNLARHRRSAPTTEQLLFLGFFFAFAIKAPLWPVHTWLPGRRGRGAARRRRAARRRARQGRHVRHAPVLPAAVPGRLAVGHAGGPDARVIGILYGALLAIGQTDIKRLIAYTSISHFGFIVLGIFAMTSQGQSGSTLYMVNHGFSTAALFLIAGFLISRRGSRLIADYGGVQRVAPMLAGTFLVAGLSSLALPGLSSFVSEFLVLVGTFTRVPGRRDHRDRRHHPRLALRPAACTSAR